MGIVLTRLCSRKPKSLSEYMERHPKLMAELEAMRVEMHGKPPNSGWKAVRLYRNGCGNEVCEYVWWESGTPLPKRQNLLHETTKPVAYQYLRMDNGALICV